MGPGQGFEPWQKAPQASRLPSYLTPATIDGLFLVFPNHDTHPGLFTFSHKLNAINSHKVLKSDFAKGDCLSFGMNGANNPFIALPVAKMLVPELNVELSVFSFLMSEKMFHMNEISGIMIFQRCSPMSHCMKVN
jgi:hypothetical protein